MDSKCATYHIGEIAEKLGLSTRSIRYYEELGLLKPNRTNGGFRQYTELDLNRIKMVLRFKDLGMTLEEIRALVEPGEDPLEPARLQTLKAALALRKRDFEEKIQKYREGIEQIDAVIEQLSRCGFCGSPREKEVCQNCLGENREGISPLLDPLMEK